MPATAFPSRSKVTGFSRDTLDKLNRCSLEYSFAIILKPGGVIETVTNSEGVSSRRLNKGRSSVGERETKSGAADQVSDLVNAAAESVGEATTSVHVHMTIIETLRRAELQVAFLQCTDKAQDEDRVILLVKADTAKADRERDSEGKEMPTVLTREHAKLFMERHLTLGDQAGDSTYHAVSEDSLTTAKKIQLTHRIIKHALDSVSHSLDLNVDASSNAVTAYSYIESVFPLHDRQWNADFLGMYMSDLFNWRRWFASIGSARKAVVAKGASAMAAAKNNIPHRARVLPMVSENKENKEPDMEAVEVVKQPLKRGPGAVCDDYDPQDWVVQELRQHLGERVAFYFAFLTYYTTWLLPLALGLLIFYLVVRMTSWSAYMRGLSILGVAVPAVWAPLMVRYWQRRSSDLHHQWDLRHVPESENPNPDAKFASELVPGTTTGERRRRYDPNNNRRKVLLGFIPFACLNVLLMMVSIMPFVQWYAYGRMVPTCECCEWHQRVGITFNETAAKSWPGDPLPEDCHYLLPEIATKAPTECTYFVNCFNARATTLGTDRWAYIFLQGVLLGILLDVVQFNLFKAITAWLTKLEHWPSMAQFERHLISKQFFFCWMNMYFWFFATAFIYVPFGEQIQEFLRGSSLSWFVPYYGWQTGNVAIDSAFVTPLVVTQAVNLLLETGVPYLGIKVKKAVNKPIKMASHAVDGWTSSGAPVKGGSVRMLHHGSSRIIRVNAVELDRSMKSGARLHRIIDGLQKNNLLPDGPIDIFQETPDPDLVNADEGEVNANHYTFGEVLTQGRLGDWDSRDDFLDTLMQFGYVLMFTIAWSLAPITALVNNVIEIRFDSFKLLYNNRRPLPLEDQGIGEWANALNSSVAYALPVVAGLVVIGTGQLEFWRFGTCQERFYKDDVEAMDPDLNCFDSWGIRLLVGVVIERIAVSIVFLIRKIPKISKETQAELDKIETEQRRRIQDSLLPTLPPGLKQNLWVIFRHFDADGNGILSMTELPGVLDKLKRGEKLKPQYLKMFLSFVDVDASATVTFAEFALALKRAQDDFVLNEVLDIANLAAQAQKLADQIREGGDVGKGSGQGSSDQLMDVEDADYS